MLIVGLTGGIASGKSTVSAALREKHGVAVVDADQIARDVVQPGRPAYRKIVAAFADVEDLVLDSGALNREALGKHVFGNKDRLHVLNSIVHPAVKRQIAWLVLGAYVRLRSIVVLDVPLLFELGLHLICGKVITVTCDLEVQVERLLARNRELTADDAMKRINSQMSNRERCLRADIVIDNNKGILELHEAVASAVREVTPSILFTVLDWIPPVAVLSAALTVVTRYMLERYRKDGHFRR